MQPWQLVLIGVAGWMNRRQQQVIDYVHFIFPFHSQNLQAVADLEEPCSDALLKIGVIHICGDQSWTYAEFDRAILLACSAVEGSLGLAAGLTRCGGCDAPTQR
jgi:hypothetical protein